MQGPLSVEEEKLRVKDVVSADGWDWSKISIPILESISNILKPVLYLLLQEERKTSLG